MHIQYSTFNEHRRQCCAKCASARAHAHQTKYITAYTIGLLPPHREHQNITYVPVDVVSIHTDRHTHTYASGHIEMTPTKVNCAAVVGVVALSLCLGSVRGEREVHPGWQHDTRTHTHTQTRAYTNLHKLARKFMHIVIIGRISLCI